MTYTGNTIKRIHWQLGRKLFTLGIGTWYAYPSKLLQGFASETGMLFLVWHGQRTL